MSILLLKKPILNIFETVRPQAASKSASYGAPTHESQAFQLDPANNNKQAEASGRSEPGVSAPGNQIQMLLSP